LAARTITWSEGWFATTQLVNLGVFGFCGDYDRVRPTGSERKLLSKDCGWNDGDRGGSGKSLGSAGKNTKPSWLRPALSWKDSGNRWQANREATLVFLSIWNDNRLIRSNSAGTL